MTDEQWEKLRKEYGKDAFRNSYDRTVTKGVLLTRAELEEREKALTEQVKALKDSLKWALQYGTFECSVDNPMHKEAHLRAIALVPVEDK